MAKENNKKVLLTVAKHCLLLDKVFIKTISLLQVQNINRFILGNINIRYWNLFVSKKLLLTTENLIVDFIRYGYNFKIYLQGLSKMLLACKSTCF